MPISLTEKQIESGPRYSQLRRFFSTATERNLIRLRREADLPQPWTKDKIFRKYRFCNPDRENDKVTIWLRENWRDPYADHNNLVFSMALARLINWPPTLEEIGFPKQWDPKRTVRIIKARQERGEKVYTAAYLLGAIPKGASKAEYLVNDVLTPLYCKLLTQNIGSTLEEAWNWFQEQRGIGNFLAYEIVTDLRHTNYLKDAPDIMTWTNMGPGALRGLTRLWGYQPKTSKGNGYIFPKKHALEAARLLLEKSKEFLPSDMLPWEMRHVEMWSCEHDKYERIRLGQGTLDKFVPMQPDQWTKQDGLIGLG